MNNLQLWHIYRLLYRAAELHRLAGRYDNHIPESNIFPQSGTKNLASGEVSSKPITFTLYTKSQHITIIHCYKTIRKITPPSTEAQDSSCWVGENDCFICAGNLRPQVPKFSVITGNFRRFLLWKKEECAWSVPLDYYSCPLPLDHGYHVLKVKKYTVINIE